MKKALGMLRVGEVFKYCGQAYRCDGHIKYTSDYIPCVAVFGSKIRLLHIDTLVDMYY